MADITTSATESSSSKSPTSMSSPPSSSLGHCSKVTALLVAISSIVVYLAFSHDTVLEQVDRVLDSLQTTTRQELVNHIYLHNNYAPVRDEHVAVTGARVVQGQWPSDLSGLFVRNGPNPIPEHDWNKGYHWFDGHGQLHTLRFLPSQQDETETEAEEATTTTTTSILYSNQYVPTPRYQIERAKGKEYFLRIGELKGIVGLLKAMVLEPRRRAISNLDELTVGQANTHTIMTRDHKFYALHEASLPFELELNHNGSLVVVGQSSSASSASSANRYDSLDSQLNYPVSAHPKVDPLTGHLLFHSYSASPELIATHGNYKVGEYSPAKRRLESYYGIRTADGHTSFAHDLMFTKNWFVLYDNSVHFDPSQIMNATGSIFSWNPNASLKIGLAPRPHIIHQNNATSDDVVWFDVQTPHVMIHPLNAWEEDDGTVVLWSPCGDYFDLNIDQGTNIYHMTEFRMNPHTKTVTKTIIDDTWNVEFPRIRHDYLGRFGRYGTATIMEPALGGDGLFKGFVVYDMLQKKVHKTVLYREGVVGGEAVPIPKPNTMGAGEFYVGTLVRNVLENKSYFLLFDGEGNGDSDDSLVARVEIPYRVPYGFHCEWLDEGQLQGHLNHHKNKKKVSSSAATAEE